MIYLLREPLEPWGARVSSELPAIELPREQCGSHPSTMCCISHLSLSLGVIPLSCIPRFQRRVLVQSGKGIEGEGLIGGLKDAAT